MTKRVGPSGRTSASESMAFRDPRWRRTFQNDTTQVDLAETLTVDRRGRLSLRPAAKVEIPARRPTRRTERITDTATATTEDVALRYNELRTSYDELRTAFGELYNSHLRLVTVLRSAGIIER